MIMSDDGELWTLVEDVVVMMKVYKDVHSGS